MRLILLWKNCMFEVILAIYGVLISLGQNYGQMNKSSWIETGVCVWPRICSFGAKTLGAFLYTQVYVQATSACNHVSGSTWLMPASKVYTRIYGAPSLIHAYEELNVKRAVAFSAASKGWGRIFKLNFTFFHFLLHPPLFLSLAVQRSRLEWTPRIIMSSSRLQDP